MAISLDAHCFACGYDVVVITGAGMLNYQTYAAWPVHCRSCEAVTVANMKTRPLACETCNGTDVVSYAEKELSNGDGEPVHTWDDLTLTDGKHLCPRCRAYALRFGTGAGGHGPMLLD